MPKKVNKILLAVTALGAILYVFPPRFDSVSADNTNFQVNVKEILSVSISTPTDWASGYADEFLRNTITVNVTSNNNRGFTAGMTTKTPNTYLKHTVLSDTRIPTLAENSSHQEFPANYWGYSLNDEQNDGLYKPLVGETSAPITILSSPSSSSGSSNVYFGAKTDITKSSGTYFGTIVISVVSGTDGSDLPAPTGEEQTTPASPGPEEEAEYNSGSDTTVYTYTYTPASGGTTTTTTQISEGNNTNLYDSYTPPQGVNKRTNSNITSGSIIATVMAVAASVSAVSGILFFALAKRKKDEK